MHKGASSDLFLCTLSATLSARVSSCRSSSFCGRARGQDGRHGHRGSRNRGRNRVPARDPRDQAHGRSHERGERCHGGPSARQPAAGGRKDRVRSHAHRWRQQDRRPESAVASEAATAAPEPELAPARARALGVSPGLDMAAARAPRSAPSPGSVPDVPRESALPACRRDASINCDLNGGTLSR